MSWTIYADNHLIYNPRIVGDDGELPYNVFEPTLAESTKSFGSLTFLCAPGSPAYDYCVELIPRIKVYNGASLYWKGRVMSVEPNIKDYRSIYVEDFLGVLLNTIFRPFEFSGEAADLLEQIVAEHNRQADENSQFYAVDSDVDEEISCASEGYGSSWSVIKDKLIGKLGGFIWVSYDAQERATLHYSLSARNTATQAIQLGENLSAFTVRNKFDQFYTACIPLGAQDNETKKYITIAPVNDDLDYLIDETAAARYGIIYAPTSVTTWKDVTLPSNLLTRAQAWLQSEAARGVQELKVSAVDASAYNVNLAPYMWLDSVLVVARGFSEQMIISALTRRLDKPAGISVQLGVERSTVSGTSASKNADAIRRIQDIEANYVTGETVTAITEQVLEESSLIEQRCNEIIAGVVQRYLTIEAYEGYEQQILQEIASQVSLMAESLSIEFNASINETGQNAQNQFDAIHSFVRIIAQTQDVNGGLVLGESTSQIKCKLENDVLYFFSGDETTVSTQNAIAYFQAGKLYVNEVQINRLTVGQTGQLMYFTIVGEGDNRCLFLSGRLV